MLDWEQAGLHAQAAWSGNQVWKTAAEKCCLAAAAGCAAQTSAALVLNRRCLLLRQGAIALSTFPTVDIAGRKVTGSL